MKESYLTFFRAPAARAWWFLVLALLSSAARADIYYGDFMYIEEEKTITIYRYQGSGGVVTVPETIVNKPVTNISDFSFSDCAGLTNVILPASITNIGLYAFADCTKLTSVLIPNNVTEIGDYAFETCTSLKSVTFGSGTTRIGTQAFEYCTALTDVNIPNNVTVLGKGAFYACSNLASVTLGSGLTSIGDWAFGSCPGLTSVTIPGNILEIGRAAFRDCSGLTRLTISKGVTTLGEEAFSGCNTLASVTLPDSVTNIGASAFVACDALTTVTIGSGVTAIGNSAFYNCTKLKEAYFKGNAPVPGTDVFFGDSLVTVYYLAGTTGWGSTFAGRPTALWNASASVTVTFDAEGGTVSPASTSVTVNAAYGALPTPARTGYIFAGWYTGDNGTGTQVTASTLVSTNANHVLYAAYVVHLTAPTVTTATTAATGAGTATSGGEVTSDGGAAVTARGVCWSTVANPTVANAKTADGSGTGAFSSVLTGLGAGITYYVRAYATNSAGTTYGGQTSFTTLATGTGVDFVITGIAIAPELPAVGGKITATITVLNQGTKSGKAGNLYVWLNKPAVAAVGEKGDKSASISTLKPGQAKTVKLALTAPKTWDTFTLRAFIDAKGATVEAEENNNQETYAYKTGLPEFEILDVQISPEFPVAGKTFAAYVTVTNSGEVAGNAGYLDVWTDCSSLANSPVPGGKTKGNKYKTVGILQPGQEKTITVTGLKAPAAGTAPVLGALIDSRGKTQELDENNNWFEVDYELE